MTNSDVFFKLLASDISLNFHPLVKFHILCYETTLHMFIFSNGNGFILLAVFKLWSFFRDAFRSQTVGRNLLRSASLRRLPPSWRQLASPSQPPRQNAELPFSPPISLPTYFIIMLVTLLEIILYHRHIGVGERRGVRISMKCERWWMSGTLRMREKSWSCDSQFGKSL